MEQSGLFYDKELFCFRKITPEELQSKFNELGYEYNFETHTAEKLRWKPKANETYYIPDVCSDPPYLVAVNEVSFLDEICIERNIAFKTQEEAIEVAKKMAATIIIITILSFLFANALRNLGKQKQAYKDAMKNKKDENIH